MGDDGFDRRRREMASLEAASRLSGVTLVTMP
jgi:hypothetical protein